MIKQTELWPVSHLQQSFKRINFPEYQREPNVWGKAAKQRLIDSIMRRFDIASIYLYEDSDGSLDCIDGRQRLGAIMSFLNDNPDDSDNGFSLRVSNEIYKEEDPPFEDLHGNTFKEISESAESGDASAQEFLSVFLEYEITIVKLSGSRRPEEFNLQFTRLNLGTIINSGEKLHAMVGAMRDVCFKKLNDNPFLETINIPTRRYAKEQVAAQILAQVFSRDHTEEWTRTRHYDLQHFFKEKSVLEDGEEELIDVIEEIMTLLAEAFGDAPTLRNRAMSVSTVLLAWEVGIGNEEEAASIAEFIKDFMCRLLWQVGLGLDAHDEYRWLIDFQRHVTQASVERYAVEGRADVLASEYKIWNETGMLTGDQQYIEENDSDPSEDCKER